MNKIIAVQTTTDNFTFKDLDSLESNIEVTTDLFNKALFVRVWKYNNLSIMRYIDSGKGVEKYYAVDLDVKPLVTVYCVQLINLHLAPLRVGCQIGVWSDITDNSTVGLARSMFWNLLFNKHDMLADCVQTYYGMRFWQNRISEAFSSGYCVYSIKLVNNKIKDAKLYTNSKEFSLDKAKLWGLANHNLNTRLLITKNPLDFKGYQKSRSTKANMNNTKLPDAWLNAGLPNKSVTAKANKTNVVARIDMGIDVAGKGLCPECRKPMEASVANGHSGLVCHADRIFLPAIDSKEYTASLSK